MRSQNSINKIVSIIIVVHNRYELLTQSIKSCFAQKDASKIELIIIDNGSTEDISKITEEFDDINFYRIDNTSIAKARNFGLSKTKCKYVSFLDSDDVLLRTKIFDQYEHLKNNNLDLSYTNYHILNDNHIFCYPFKKLNSHFWKRFFPYGTTSFMFSMDCLDKISNFDEELIVSEDWDFFIRSKKHGLRVENLHSPLYLYRIHNSNITFNNTINHQLYAKMVQIKNGLIPTRIAGNYGGWKRPLDHSFPNPGDNEKQQIFSYLKELNPDFISS